MPSELDRKYRRGAGAGDGPGRPDPDRPRTSEGRRIVANLPPTLPGMFDAFCMLHGATVAVIADGERLTFAELNEHATRLARALAGGWGVGKGDRVAIAMRNCPAWIVAYMAVLKAGGIATLVNGWWQADELRHGLALTAPCLVLCDAPRAKRLEATGLGIADVVAAGREADRRGAGAAARRGGEADLPEVAPEDDATILFTSGSTGARQGRGLHPPRGHHRHLHLFDQPARPARDHGERGPRPRQPAAHPGQRAPVPRHRRGAGAAQQLRHRPRHGADGEMGSRARRCG